MRESIVINTTPILTIIAACGNLQILEKLYEKIIVPLEVQEEILEGGKSLFGVEEFLNSKCLTIPQSHIIIPKIVEHGIWLSERVIKEVLSEDNVI